MSLKKLLMASTMAASVAVSFGCSTSPVTEDEFGDSVRQMVRSQKIFVAVEEQPVSQSDGQRLEAVLEGYRSNEQPAVGAAPASILINTSN